jgi:hypothetical protein
MFEYLIDKIDSASINTDPFPHLEINNFFSREDFKKIIASSDITLEKSNSDEQLFESLFGKGYEIIEFPGCVSNLEEYADWHKNKWKNIDLNPACESFGMALRLEKYNDSFINEIGTFFGSEIFIETIASKFEIDTSKTYFDGGIQKYLDGYEISPHSDIRRKAITYMVNINPDPNSENEDYHTHYLKLINKYQYLYSFWKNNQDIERCWIPWNWCESIKMQKQNNSIVIFSPTDYTLHAIKANYDHLHHQRTQIYGNLWFQEIPTLAKKEWYDLDIVGSQSVKMAEPTLLEKTFSRLRKLRFNNSQDKQRVAKSKNISAKYK